MLYRGYVSQIEVHSFVQIGQCDNDRHGNARFILDALLHQSVECNSTCLFVVLTVLELNVDIKPALKFLVVASTFYTDFDDTVFPIDNGLLVPF